MIENNEYAAVSFDDCNFTDEIGQPEIPYKEITLGVPDGAILQYSLSNIKYETITNITPLPVGQPFRDNSGITSLKRIIDTEIFNFNPNEIFEFSKQEYFKDLL